MLFPRQSIFVFAVLMLGLAAGGLHAQEPASIAPALDPPIDRWAVLLDFAFSGSSGNERLTVLTTGARVTHLQKKDYELELSTQLRYGRSEGKEVARNLRGGAKFDLQPEADWSPFFFVNGEQDPFKKLDFRGSGGMGFKYTFLRTPTTKLSLSLAGLYSYEDYQLALNSAFAQFQQNARQSWRLKANTRLPSGFRVDHATFYQPIWDEADDYRIDSSTTLLAPVTQRLSVNFTYTYERDSTPPPEVRKDDHLVKAGITVRL